MIESFTYPESGKRIYFIERNRNSIKNKILDILGTYCAPNGKTLSFKTFLQILEQKFKVSIVVEKNSGEDIHSMVHNRLILHELKRHGGNGVRILTVLQYTGWLDENGEMSEKWRTLHPQSSTRFQWAYIIEQVNSEVEQRKNKDFKSGLKLGKKSIELIGSYIKTQD